MLQNRTGPVADRAVDWGVVVPSLEQRQLYNTMRYECSPLSEGESIYDVIKSVSVVVDYQYTILHCVSLMVNICST